MRVGKSRPVPTSAETWSRSEQQTWSMFFVICSTYFPITFIWQRLFNDDCMYGRGAYQNSSVLCCRPIPQYIPPHTHTGVNWVSWFIMRPSSLGGGRILRRTLSVCLSLCPSVCLSIRPVIITERHVAPPSELQWHMYFWARAEGRISYGHLGRTNLLLSAFACFFSLETCPATRVSDDAPLSSVCRVHRA